MIEAPAFTNTVLTEEQKEDLKAKVTEFLAKYPNEKDRSSVLKSLQFTLTTMIKEPKRNRIDLGNSMNKVLEAKAPGNIGSFLEGVGFKKRSDTLF